MFNSHILFVVLALSAPQVAHAEEVKAQPVTIEEKIDFYSNKYKVSRETVSKVVQCESSKNPDAVGDSGHSFGIAQFYLPAGNKTVDGRVMTKEMALDPDVALDTLAYYLSTGKARKWTCARMLGLAKDV